MELELKNANLREQVKTLQKYEERARFRIRKDDAASGREDSIDEEERRRKQVVKSYMKKLKGCIITLFICMDGRKIKFATN